MLRRVFTSSGALTRAQRVILPAAYFATSYQNINSSSNFSNPDPDFSMKQEIQNGVLMKQIQQMIPEERSREDRMILEMKRCRKLYSSPTKNKREFDHLVDDNRTI